MLYRLLQFEIKERHYEKHPHARPLSVISQLSVEIELPPPMPLQQHPRSPTEQKYHDLYTAFDDYYPSPPTDNDWVNALAY